MSESWRIQVPKALHSALSGVATTAFTRDMKSEGVPKMTGDRVFCVCYHLALPAVAYVLSTGGYYEAALAKMGVATYALAANRKLMLHALDVLYGVRWAVQDVVQLSGKGGYLTSSKVAFFHYTLHTSVTWMLVYATPGLPNGIVPREMAGATIMVVGGLLQCVPEVQRYLFKRKPENAGKLHTGGLFSLARFINTSGHVLRDVGATILTRTPHLIPIFFMVDYPLMTVLCATETVAYMRAKYKAAYAAYEATTPSLFIPGVW